MKIGVSSYSFAKHMAQTGCSYFDICDKAKEIGFDGIEFIDLDHENPLALAKEIRAHCEKIGLQVAAYTVWGDMLSEDIDAEVERLCRNIDVCEALGAKVLRFDLCYETSFGNLYSWKELADSFVPAIRKIADYGQSKGIRTCSENHGYIFQDPVRVEYLIKQVNHKNYGWLCDMGNFLCADADSVESVKIALPYIFHVHAKDFLFKSGGKCPQGFFPTTGGNWLRGTVLNHGVVDVARCIQIIKMSGYDGWFSLEFEGMEECIPAITAGYDFLKEQA